jgi:transcriptional regulator with XRE-family HTH domain
MPRGSEETYDTDKIIGTNILTRRTCLGMSRQQVAKKIGVTHQQIQKYERGTNRIPASRLPQFSRALGMSLDEFYDEFPDTALDSTSRIIIELVRNLKAMPEGLVFAMSQHAKHLHSYMEK